MVKQTVDKLKAAGYDVSQPGWKKPAPEVVPPTISVPEPSMPVLKLKAWDKLSAQELEGIVTEIVKESPYMKSSVNDALDALQDAKGDFSQAVQFLKTQSWYAETKAADLLANVVSVAKELGLVGADLKAGAKVPEGAEATWKGWTSKDVAQLAKELDPEEVANYSSAVVIAAVQALADSGGDLGVAQKALVAKKVSLSMASANTLLMSVVKAGMPGIFDVSAEGKLVPMQKPEPKPKPKPKPRIKEAGKLSWGNLDPTSFDALSDLMVVDPDFEALGVKPSTVDMALSLVQDHGGSWGSEVSAGLKGVTPFPYSTLSNIVNWAKQEGYFKQDPVKPSHVVPTEKLKALVVSKVAVSKPPTFSDWSGVSDEKKHDIIAAISNAPSVEDYSQGQLAVAASSIMQVGDLTKAATLVKALEQMKDTDAAFLVIAALEKGEQLGLFSKEVSGTKVYPAGGVAPVAAPPAAEVPAGIAAASPVVAPKPQEATTVSSASAAAKVIGLAPSSSYFPALSMLVSKGGDVGQAVAALKAAQPTKGGKTIPWDKRVKNVAKKLADAVVTVAPPDVVAYETPEGLPLKLAPAYPGGSGQIGNLDAELVIPEDQKPWIPPPPPPPPPVPDGYPTPEAGKMWKVQPASQFFGSGMGGHLYKIKPPKDKATGAKLEDAPDQIVKLQGLSLGEAEEALKQAGLMGKLLTPLKYKADQNKVYVHVNKSDWEAALAAGKTIGVQVPLPPPPAPPTPPSGKFTTIPKAGELRNPVIVPNLQEMDTLAENKDLRYGKAFNIGGEGVLHQSVSALRMKDYTGKVFYRFSFRARPGLAKRIAAGGVEKECQLPASTYNATTDTWDASAPSSSYGSDLNRFPASAHESEGSTIYKASSSAKWSYRNMVMADISPKPGETVRQAFERTLASIDPSLPAEVLTNPTPAQRELEGLTALHWSAMPQEADKLKESDRTVPYLRGRLKQAGYTDADMNSIRFEQVGVDQVTPVLPGRIAKLRKSSAEGGQDVSHIVVSVGDPVKVVKQIVSGTVGVIQRQMAGIPAAGTSPSQDLERGGGEYVFANVRQKSGYGSYNTHWGSIHMIYDSSELDRLDTFKHQSVDGYGCTKPTGHGDKSASWRNRTPLEHGVGTAQEVLFRRGISSRKLLKIATNSSYEAKAVKEGLMAQGITHLNGIPIEELIVSPSSTGAKEFYNTYLEPAGY